MSDRLFVAAWPSAQVVDAVARLERPPAGVRWTTSDQWHVTLRFLGSTTNADAVADRLAGAALQPATATIGPRSVCLGWEILCLPVAGVDALAAAVIKATADLGQPPDAHPFVGHLTLARSRKNGAGLAALAGAEASGSWPVDEISVVASTLGGSGSRYEVVRRIPLR